MRPNIPRWRPRHAAGAVAALCVLSLLSVLWCSGDEHEPPGVAPPLPVLDARSALWSRDSLGDLALDAAAQPDDLVGARALAAYLRLSGGTDPTGLQDRLVARARASSSSDAGTTPDPGRRIASLVAIAELAPEGLTQQERAEAGELTGVVAEQLAPLTTSMDGLLLLVETSWLTHVAGLESTLDEQACTLLQETEAEARTAQAIATLYSLVSITASPCEGASDTPATIDDFASATELDGCFLYAPAAAAAGGTDFIADCWSDVARMAETNESQVAVPVLDAFSILHPVLPDAVTASSRSTIARALGRAVYFDGRLSPTMAYNPFGRVLSWGVAGRLGMHGESPVPAAPFADPGDPFSRLVLQIGTGAAPSAADVEQLGTSEDQDWVEMSAALSVRSVDCGSLGPRWVSAAQAHLNNVDPSTLGYMHLSMLGVVAERLRTCFPEAATSSAAFIAALARSVLDEATHAAGTALDDGVRPATALYHAASFAEAYCGLTGTPPFSHEIAVELSSVSHAYVDLVLSGHDSGMYLLGELYAALRLIEIDENGCSGAWWE